MQYHVPLKGLCEQALVLLDGAAAPPPSESLTTKWRSHFREARANPTRRTDSGGPILQQGNRPHHEAAPVVSPSAWRISAAASSSASSRAREGVPPEAVAVRERVFSCMFAGEAARWPTRRRVEFGMVDLEDR